MAKLISDKTNKEIKVGDRVTDFRGQKWIVKGFIAPKHSASTGRVHLQGNTWEHEYYPSVIDAHIEE